MERELFRPVDFARLRIERINRVGIPDDKLSFAARFIDHWRAITLGLGRQRFPQLFASVFMEYDDDAAFAAYQADQFFAINEWMAGEAPGLHRRIIVFVKV